MRFLDVDNVVLLVKDAGSHGKILVVGSAALLLGHQTSQGWEEAGVLVKSIYISLGSEKVSTFGEA